MKQAYARRLYDAVMKNFLVSESTMAFLEFFPRRPEDRDTCYLFSYFGVAGTMYRAIKAGQEDVREPYRKLIENFVYYQDGQMPQGQSKYHSERGSSPKSGHGPCFFDDNIWVARNLLCAYEVFGASSYIEEAKKLWPILIQHGTGIWAA